MNNLNISKCPSCGAANMQDADEARTNCIQCGSSLSLMVKKNSLFKKIIKIGLLLALFSSAAMYFVNRQTEEILQQVLPSSTTLDITKISQPQALNAIPKINSKAMTVTNEQVKQVQKKEKQLTLLDFTKAENKKGEIYWLILVKNQSTKSVFRPRAKLELLDSDNQIIDTYNAYAKLEQLPANKSTVILLALPQKPREEFHVNIHVLASFETKSKKQQEVLDISEVSVVALNTEKTQFEITGRVYNPNNYQVDFAEIIAIAHDDHGKLASYSSNYAQSPNIAAKDFSIFKIKADKYIALTPDYWTVTALAKQH